MGKFPALRIAVTNKCNMNCFYCPKDGDSYVLENRVLNLSEFIKIVNVSHKIGFRSFSLTGGEPLSVPDITFPLAEFIHQLKPISYLKMNTNGILLESSIKNIVKSGFTEIKVSLDIITPNNPNSTSHYQSNVESITKGIKHILKHSIPVRLQTVVTQSNINELDKVINFCTKLGINLKLFDLTYYEDSLSQSKNYWQKNYISLTKIANKLSQKFGQPKIIHAVGGFGHPNKVFTTPQHTQIMLRDTEISAYYSSKCHQCQSYMCQDGICTLTLSTDGRLKICRPRGINLGLSLIDKKGYLKNDKQIYDIFKKAIDIFQKSKETKRSFSQLNLPPILKS